MATTLIKRLAVSMWLAGDITITASNNVNMDAAIDTEAGALTITGTGGDVDLAAVAIGANDVNVTAGT